MSMKKFTSDTTVDEVSNKDIIVAGDWVLKWNEKKSNVETSGYEFFAPDSFDYEAGEGPIGGVLLAAFYYLLEHDGDDFHKLILERANKVCRDRGGGGETTKRSLN